MITKVEGTKYGYKLEEGVTSNEEFQSVIRSHPFVKCIIANANTMRHFQRPVVGRNIFTVNNHVKNNEFYINYFR